jgi:aspartyl-tRNA(Asn)/glutamyl-tRNA(Gln) amidotransferase subunit A
VQAEVADCVARAVRVFQSQGAIVDTVDLPMNDARDAIRVLWPVGNANGVRAMSAAQRALLEPGLSAMVAAAADTDALSYLAAVSARERVQIRMNKLFENFDLLLTPTMPMTALPVGRIAPELTDGHITWSEFTYPFNFTMQPAASAPCGFTSAGLPVGLQIIGQRFADALVLRAARAYERASPFRMPWDVPLSDPLLSD